MPNTKNKKQKMFYEFMFPVHKHKWLIAYKKLLPKISRYKQEYGFDFTNDIAEIYGLPCKYTGKQLTYKNISIDHIIPLARGGENVKENIQIISNEANRSKGTLTGQEYGSYLTWLETLPEEAQKYVKMKMGSKPKFV